MNQTAASPAPPRAPLALDGPLTTRTVAGPRWARNLPVYEVNPDVYRFPKGAALREYEKQHLPVLKEMGVGFVWFMPLHPRGRKKGFGSPYAVRDYRDINPDLGTKDDFRRLVGRAHALGLRVLMDWVPNHTAWDNPMIETHPEFYAKNDKGEIVQAGPWADVAQLDYGKPGKWNRPLWDRMRDDMAFWVREFDVDGFRCDVAGRGGKVPVEFWRWLRPQLDAVRPVFLLAEADDAYLHPALDMTYSWNLPPVLWDVCAGRKPATAIDDELRKEAGTYPAGAIRMRFLDNHDWHGHADWGWGNGPAIDMRGGMPQVAPLMVLCTTLPGKPLLYNGQEMGFAKTDPPREAAERRRSPVWPFYRRLLELYRSRPAIFEGGFSKVASGQDDRIYAFVRRRGRERVLVAVNLSDRAQTATLGDASLSGGYRDWFGGRDVTLGATPSLDLEAWGYRVYVGRTR
uniref:GH13 / GH13_38 / GH13_36 / GH13_17 / GH13_ 20 / GH13_30 / GH13_23 / GH13_16 / GH13_4 / GH13_2 n=1 Tax=uncultured Armatimonadetes bacterium TaxID=157466 RepID=A0A6J4IDS1_9BACT|nr:GH13 / GH13_38 / GH13_36 / GH13_17 / GH13_ 20 / GH13_30 / GH13_23 / GH13_16 / GH13_4 / GH13_2 [uncultured Armatimonadetes bacterium]